jgi:LysM repeat protein
MAKTENPTIRAQRIQAEIAYTQLMLDRTVKLLAIMDKSKLPNDTPFISDIKVGSIDDIKRLLSLNRGLHNELIEDAKLAKQQLEELKNKGKFIANEIRAYRIHVRQQNIRARDRQGERRAKAILNQVAKEGGAVDACQLSEIRKEFTLSLNAYVDFLNDNPSDTAITDVLNQIGQNTSVGIESDDTAISEAWDSLQSAGKKRVESAKKEFEKKPTQRQATILITAALFTDQVSGGDQVQKVLEEDVIPFHNKLTEQQVDKFRKNPNKAQALVMWNQEQAAARSGASEIERPPKSLRRVKQGSHYTIKEGDTLSEISKTYYGTWAHWDQLVWANPELGKDADRPPVGSTITIPF